MSKTTTRTILGAATLAFAFQTYAAVLPPTRGGRPKPQPQPCTIVSKIGCLPMPPSPRPATPPAPRTGK